MERWMRDLQREVVAFPDTLRQFREGVNNFQKITKRLADATIALEAMTPSVEALRQLEDTARAVQRGVAHAPGAELVGSAFEELSKRLTEAAEKNPFMRRPPESR
jgi:hypothetical protein